ncbi:MAG: hypothetical protein Q8Q33_10270 [Chlamydiota bacterium]|nr:hypothetical protein [Chlamydiota bacterium]
MKTYYPLKKRYYTLLIIMILIIRCWLYADQEFLPGLMQRMFVFIGIISVALFVFYQVVQPDKPINLSHYLAIILVPVAILLSCIQHLIIHQDFGMYYMRSIVIWCIVLLAPYTTAALYTGIQSKCKKKYDSDL